MGIKSVFIFKVFILLSSKYQELINADFLVHNSYQKDNGNRVHGILF